MIKKHRLRIRGGISWQFFQLAISCIFEQVQVKFRQFTLSALNVTADVSYPTNLFMFIENSGTYDTTVIQSKIMH